LAKSKLSKWAARLFDPNRPRGLVEPPKTWVLCCPLLLFQSFIANCVVLIGM
jgi:hypothetical protein